MKLIIATIMLAVSATANADTYVRGYTRSDGTYVQPHYRSNPDQYRFDNYSSQSNSNPYTGQRGYERNEFSNPPSYNQYQYQYAPPPLYQYSNPYGN